MVASQAYAILLLLGYYSCNSELTDICFVKSYVIDFHEGLPHTDDFITTFYNVYMYLLDSDDNSELKEEVKDVDCRVTFTSLELTPIQPKRFMAATFTPKFSGQSLNGREIIKEFAVSFVFSAGT